MTDCNIDYDEILKRMAPCGLKCEKCFAFNHGDIQFHSSELKKSLGAFDKYAERFSQSFPIFNHYPAFKELLEHFASGDCPGCRNGQCKFSHCGVVHCYKTKNVDFCFQCPAFPCENTNFDPHLYKRWVDMNNRMKEIGPVAFYLETKDLPRYI